MSQKLQPLEQLVASTETIKRNITDFNSPTPPIQFNVTDEKFYRYTDNTNTAQSSHNLRLRYSLYVKRKWIIRLIRDSIYNTTS